jgi:hypothetical protein
VKKDFEISESVSQLGKKAAAKSKKIIKSTTNQAKT